METNGLSKGLRGLGIVATMAVTLMAGKPARAHRLFTTLPHVGQGQENPISDYVTGLGTPQVPALVAALVARP
jgi:hypothetical protein